MRVTLTTTIVFIVVAYVLYGWIQRDALEARDAQDAQDYSQGTEDADNAKTDTPDDDAGIIEWLLRF